MIIINAHAFNAGFAGAQLAERVENAGVGYMSERIAVAATAIAEWESGGGAFYDCDHRYDFVCDVVAKLVSSSMNSDDDALEVLYLAVQKIVIKGGAV